MQDVQPVVQSPAGRKLLTEDHLRSAIVELRPEPELVRVRRHPVAAASAEESPQAGLSTIALERSKTPPRERSRHLDHIPLGVTPVDPKRVELE